MERLKEEGALMIRYAAVLFFVSILASVFLLNPNIKAKTIELLLNSQRIVLSQLIMEIENKRYKVIKIQNLNGLAVEVYKINEGESMLLDSQQLTDKKDAFYKFGDAKHNLFLKDINEDGRNEIILPSIDKNMRARLNIFIFDSENEILQKVTQH